MSHTPLLYFPPPPPPRAADTLTIENVISILFIDKTNVGIGSNTSVQHLKWMKYKSMLLKQLWNRTRIENVEIRQICHFHISSSLQRGRASDGWPQPFVQPATQRLHWIVATSQNILPAFDFTNKSWRQFFACFEIVLFFLPLLNCQKYVSKKQTNICFTFLCFMIIFLVPGESLTNLYIMIITCWLPIPTLSTFRLFLFSCWGLVLFLCDEQQKLLFFASSSLILRD